jgi:hypothetical protein
MVNVHHRTLKRFSLDGTIYDDSAIWRLKIEYLRLIISQMRLSGYVPRIDIAPDFTIEYNDKTEVFNFELSIYGIYVGKRKSEWIFGVDETKVISIQHNKLEEYLREVA